ncbi:hypothetical protein C5167_014659 [Papaver somniferum]|uniref:Uncharacterized protein n=1 Tax=Papaver somniferum TaxID=3469 RepID=A0A4Y7J3W2_PAPSO|nr:uncharacterized protein LOC113361749 [Papaver somniferum]RZC55814.1 hypothetical protein C5167_014659 [Papaver somniferum]
MATRKSIFIVGFFFTLIALQSMTVTAQAEHNCFLYLHRNFLYNEGLSCAGAIVYNTTEDVDCIPLCRSFDASAGISCAEILYVGTRAVCACFTGCDPREENIGPNF